VDPLLQRLVRIPSVCGERKPSTEIIELTANFLAERGMHVERFEDHGFPSLVATTRPGVKTPKVLLAAHLDVMAAPQNLFDLRLEDGVYYGRGVFDMKFAAAAYLHVVDQLRSRLADYDFGIMFTTDEELHGQYGTGMLVDRGYLPGVCILPDASSDWNMETFAKGCWFSEIHVQGKTSHGARPWEGDSASLKLIHLLHELTATFKDGQKPHTSTLNVGKIKSGTMINQTPDEAMAALDIRFVDYTDFLELEAQVLRLCQKYKAQLRTLRPLAVPIRQDLAHPLIAPFCQIVTAQTGIVPEGTTSYGGSDARFFFPHGVPCILASPRGGDRHTDTEWLDAASYQHTAPILRAYLDKVAHAPTSTA